MSVYVVGRGEYVESTEVLGVEAGGQWTSLAYFDLTPDKRLHVDAMARVGNQKTNRVFVCAYLATRPNNTHCKSCNAIGWLVTKMKW
ncbi:unnamed protein product [Hymenolepis diminuta]|uniref:Sema domain-containing protein n=1 Tax=Hymenolepis diminuta TaxID=6216 RepID=A0A0R3SLN0_HYMDI|nr:unnamed protein product [Hymenolepis diminuta]